MVMKFTSNEIRNMWLDFWKSKGHDIIPSASLIPQNDPSLLWINAGVAPLKKFFDGREIPANPRMANVQKSLRTNDIENVGLTARHHTFFEMLGNFSIGDYFRKEALAWAIEILTSPRWFAFDLNRLYFTIHPSDLASKQIWMELGVPENHILELEENFWEIGEGPCGPCTEVFYDRGPEYGSRGVELIKEDIENDRYIEIWNIVFSQYSAEAGKERSEYRELPNKNIDTGMGLERMACVLQGAETNYDTDLFHPIIRETEKLTGKKYAGDMAFKVIADHVRSVVFAVADGATISNEGRGYVLRRILRRAVRFGRKLGMAAPFLYKLVPVVSEIMKDYYPYLEEKTATIQKIIRFEEEKFLQTLEAGEKRLLEYIDSTDEKIISGPAAFLLYDTFGYPYELTVEVVSEHGFKVDEEGFRKELEKQKEKSRAAREEEQSMGTQVEAFLAFKDESSFLGYDQLELETEILALFQDGKRVGEATGTALAVFKETPFYAEAGGQIGDRGYLEANGKKYEITDTTKLPNFQHASVVQLGQDVLKEKQSVRLKVESSARLSASKNHSATHLLNEALRKVLGAHVSQQGSYVGDEVLRFDFNHYSLPDSEAVLAVEDLVNEKIRENLEVSIKEMPLEEAEKLGAQALFGEKYGEFVRVVDMDFSIELCGGCHVRRTGEIGKFAILGLESKGSGIYRITAATEGISEKLEDVLSGTNKEIADLRVKIKALLEEAEAEGISLDYVEVPQAPLLESYRTVIERRKEAAELQEAVKELDKKLAKAKKEKNVIALEEYLQNNLTIKGYNVLISKTQALDSDVLKDLADRLADKLGNAVVFLANVLADRIVFVCKNKIEKLNAGLLVREAAQITAGAGGGRRDFAQAGGKDLSKLDEALATITGRIESEL